MPKLVIQTFFDNLAEAIEKSKQYAISADDLQISMQFIDNFRKQQKNLKVT